MLIVIDGLDGSGKSTQFKLVNKILSKNNNVKAISFPDYDKPSSVLVRMYLNGEIAGNAGEVNAYAASSFYAVDRYASYKMFWENNYRNGDIILASRYVSSNAIHQMAKLNEKEWDSYLDWLSDYEYHKLLLPQPDLVIFLDMAPEISQKLLSARYGGDENKKDIHESDIFYMQSCRKSALYAAKMLGWIIVSCSDGIKPLPVADVTNQIIDIIKNRINNIVL